MRGEDLRADESRVHLAHCGNKDSNGKGRVALLNVQMSSMKSGTQTGEVALLEPRVLNK